MITELKDNDRIKIEINHLDGIKVTVQETAFLYYIYKSRIVC